MFPLFPFPIQHHARQQGYVATGTGTAASAAAEEL